MNRKARQIRALCQAIGRPLDADLVGASWWYRDLARQGDRLLRTRRLVQFTSVGAGFTLLGGCAEVQVGQPAKVDTLALQRHQGWNVGQEGQQLVFPGAVQRDVDGGDLWWRAIDQLATSLAPVQAALQPFYVPTLFQAPISPAGAGLREQMRPIATPAMAAAFQRGLGLRSLLLVGGFPRDVALVIDLPGPEAVAVAAALASDFEPVFTFDNWPHPAGVVPSHLTLAATLYYLPILQRGARERPPSAPPVFVLDSDRLAPYSDESWSFDNRYLARLPGPAELGRLGVQRLLYVTGSGRSQELDDLNDDFVALERAGVDVRMLSLDEFQALAGADWDAMPEADRPYYLGGQPGFQLDFWSWYGWGIARHCPPPPPHLARYCQYRPQPRATLFQAVHASSWVHAPRAFPGFGQAGGVTHLRSGSFGRSHGSHVS